MERFDCIMIMATWGSDGVGVKGYQSAELWRQAWILCSLWIHVCVQHPLKNYIISHLLALSFTKNHNYLSIITR